MGLESVGWSVLGGVAAAAVVYAITLINSVHQRSKALRALVQLISSFERVLKEDRTVLAQEMSEHGVPLDVYWEDMWSAQKRAVRNWVSANSAAMKPEEAYYLLSTIDSQEIASRTIREAHEREDLWDTVFERYLSSMEEIPWIPYKRTQ
ncbi:MAG: hypothetical protein OXH12_05345 [Chloroflexi bacterium]|nr:hypothetical protein [Chloroflexota bacterium]